MKIYIKKIIAVCLALAVTVLSMPLDLYAADGNLWNKLKDKTNQVTNSIKDGAEVAGDKASEIGAEVKDSLTEAAGTAQNEITKAYNSTSEYICSVVTQIDTKKFEEGWNTAAKVATSTLAAQNSAQYVKSVQDAITKTQTNIQNTVKGNAPLASKAGFVAEEWHTGTFNIDAAARGSDYSATRPASNGKASADVIISKGGKEVQEIGLKYYQDGTASAQAQSKTIMANYQEYLSKEKQKGNGSPLSFNEYLDKNVELKKAYSILDSEYASEYARQTRLIPADQIDDATEYLKKKIGKESASEGTNRKALAKGYQDTLDNLADKIKASDGTQSVPLTESEAKALVDLCENGDLGIEDFKGLKTSQIVKPKYILKQSISAGSQSAALEVALTVGPELFSVIAEGIRSGKIDEKKLKEVGIDAALAGANGFAEGSVSAAILTACQSGKFGTKMKNASPDVIGTLTVLTIDSIKHGYRLSKGEITAEQYGDIMAEEVFVAVISQGSGALLSMILPCVPFSYFIGSMVGGLIAAEGYKIGKEIALQIAAGNGFEAIVPTYVNDAVNIGKETVQSVDVKKIGNELKNASISTTSAGIIKIKTFVNNN